jgi:ferredoxin
VLHKYLYVRQNTGLIACTGCGRCVRSCPVGINIKSVVESLMEAER